MFDIMKNISWIRFQLCISIHFLEEKYIRITCLVYNKSKNFLSTVYAIGGLNMVKKYEQMFKAFLYKITLSSYKLT